MDDKKEDIETELFTIVKAFKSGGSVKIMHGVDKYKPDYKPILTLASLFAKEGKKAKILTSCHFKSEEYQIVFGPLIGTKYERKCPDLLIDDKFYEYEGFEKPWKKEKVRRMVSHGMKQSAHMIINNTKGASDRFIRQAIVARINVGATIKEVWLYEKGRKRLFFKDGNFY
jgi:hypothetical protein